MRAITRKTHSLRCILWAFVLILVSGCKTDHRKNCNDLCEKLVTCGGDRVCEHIADDDVKTCRKRCKDTGGTFDEECVACLAEDFTCERAVPTDCEEACTYADFSEFPHQEWFCDGEPLVSNE